MRSPAIAITDCAQPGGLQHLMYGWTCLTCQFLGVWAQKALYDDAGGAIAGLATARIAVHQALPWPLQCLLENKVYTGWCRLALNGACCSVVCIAGVIAWRLNQRSPVSTQSNLRQQAVTGYSDQ